MGPNPDSPLVVLAASHPSLRRVEDRLVALCRREGFQGFPLSHDQAREVHVARAVAASRAVIVVLGSGPGLIEPLEGGDATVEENAVRSALDQERPLLLLEPERDPGPHSTGFDHGNERRYHAFKEQVTSLHNVRRFTTLDEVDREVVAFLRDVLEAVEADRSATPEAVQVEGETLEAQATLEADTEVDAEETIVRSSKDESILPATLGDKATAEDQLGFAPYVRALGAFLTHKETEPPLAVSIEGPWGSGKSSFMLQLRELLREEGSPTVWFNPWRHDKEEALWAAFAIEFLDQLRDQSPWKHRIGGAVNLLSERSPVTKEKRFVWGSAVLIGVLLLLVTLFVGVPGGFPEGAGYLASGAVALSGLVGHYASGARRVTRNLKKHIAHPDYSGRVTFLQHFQEDLARIIRSYVSEGERVYVFIDDLDRCSTPQAAELLESLHLMIPSDGPVVFVLGLDREKVAASLAAKHREILPFIAPSSLSRDDGEESAISPSGALAFGYDFLEKFIQISLRVPTPSTRELGRMLDLHSGRSSSSPGEGGTRPITAGGPLASWDPQVPDFEAWPIRELPDLPSLQLSLDRDSDTVHAVAMMVAPILGNNPRRLKQFVNLFRLQAVIAASTGLLKTAGRPRESDLTLEKLGKFVAISLQWPGLLRELRQNSSVLNELEVLAVEGQPSRPELAQSPPGWFERWGAELELLKLLRLGLSVDVDGDMDHDRYGLGMVDVSKLLKVSPPIPAEELVAGEEGQAVHGEYLY